MSMQETVLKVSWCLRVTVRTWENRWIKLEVRCFRYLSCFCRQECWSHMCTHSYTQKEFFFKCRTGYGRVGLSSVVMEQFMFVVCARVPHSSGHLHIHIYIYACVCVCVYMCMYVHTLPRPCL